MNLNQAANILVGFKIVYISYIRLIFRLRICISFFTIKIVILKWTNALILSIYLAMNKNENISPG